jgi:aminopeptidase N
MRAFTGLAALVALFAVGGSHAVAAPFALDRTPGRLSKDVVPISYRIAIVPDIAHRRFAGTETIAIEVRTPVRVIRIDSLNESLRDVRLDGARVARVTSDDAAQLTTIRLRHLVHRGAHTWTFAYTGRLESSPRGLYVQAYSRPDGTQAQMLATQFESIDARRMFPGWDEPAFRARFTLTATLPAAWATIGNMPIVTRIVHGNLATTTFAPTPPMPSYLVALCTGDLVALHDRRNGTPLTVWAARGNENAGAYALASAHEILADYDAYYAIAYPLPKLDLIAIPAGFDGGMENWGAITFEAGVLLAPAPSSLAQRQQIYGDFLSHEMAHLWTGDLVTMAWWDDIWLNESFANWRSASETDARHPEWQWWEHQDRDKEVAMDADARATSHPIATRFLDERLADAAFDAPITYSKGQAFLRMLEAYLGPERFRDGMRRYVRAHAYANATRTDLWNALSAASGIDVARFAHTWTERAGFPLVSVVASCDVQGNRTLALAQHRFLVSGRDATATRWPIPLRVRSGDGAESRFVLDADVAGVAAGRCDEPLTVNAGATGFYRVAYDAATLAVDTRAFATLPTPEKIVLLDDQWALAKSGAAPLASYLALVSGVGTGDHERVWEQVLAALDVIVSAERGTPGEPAFLTYARSIATPLSQRLGWDAVAGEPAGDALLRPMVLEDLGDWNDPAVLTEARARFDAESDAASTMPPDLHAVIVRLTARNADAATFARLRALASATHDDAEAGVLYDALMHVRDPDLAAQALAIAVSPEIRPALDDTRLEAVLTVGDTYPAAAWATFTQHAKALLAPLASDGPDGVAAELPTRLWRGVPLPIIARWLSANVPSERTIGIPRGLEAAEDLLTQTPRLIGGADAYVAGWRSGTSARISSNSGMASRNAPTIFGSNPKPDSFSICSTAMLTDAASRHGRRDVSAENVSATATMRANGGMATPCNPTG